jgi:hypothetical protein
MPLAASATKMRGYGMRMTPVRNAAQNAAKARRFVIKRPEKTTLWAMLQKQVLAELELPLVQPSRRPNATHEPEAAFPPDSIPDVVAKNGSAAAAAISKPLVSWRVAPA